MGGTCFLFGHGDTPQSALPTVQKAIEEAVSGGSSVFYVGYHGNFDRLAAEALRSVKRQNKEITLMLLLAYHPSEQAIKLPREFDGSFYPPLGNTPRRYAIVKSNQYMAREADAIICYVGHPGRTRALLEYAQRYHHSSIRNVFYYDK